MYVCMYVCIYVCTCVCVYVLSKSYETQFLAIEIFLQSDSPK